MRTLNAVAIEIAKVAQSLSEGRKIRPNRRTEIFLIARRDFAARRIILDLKVRSKVVHLFSPTDAPSTVMGQHHEGGKQISAKLDPSNQGKT
jgi:hypothetical protein